jgi:uncharacterized membrane protein
MENEKNNRSIKNVKSVVIASVASSVLLGVIWFNIEFLTSLFFKARCESFGCIGFGIIFFVEYFTVLAIILVIEAIVLVKTLTEKKTSSMIITFILTILMAFAVLAVDFTLKKSNEAKALNDAYSGCLEFARQTNTSAAYCETYRPLR